MTRACAGLAHAHDAGVVHRDIKPENIVVVRARDGDRGARPSQVVGTPVYMAPEQIRNDDVDARTDVYALGVVPYELSTGQLPFVSDDPMEILAHHLSTPPRAPSELVAGFDPLLESIILRALEKAPDNRHRDARELRTDLLALVEGGAARTGSHRRMSFRSRLTATDILANPAGALSTLSTLEGQARTLGYSALEEAIRSAFLGNDVTLGKELGDRARRALRDQEVVAARTRALVGAAPELRAQLAEDLLRALPGVPSDEAGELAVRFLRLDKPSLGMAALGALAATWGIRSRPLLVGVLDSEVDAFRLLAIEWLQRLGGMDDGSLERLARIVTAPSAAGDEVRLAAATAFATALPDCRARAVGFLQQRLAPQQGFMSSLLEAIGPREDDRVLVALARALHTLDRDGARAYLERLGAARPELRAHLDAILAGR